MRLEQAKCLNVTVLNAIWKAVSMMLLGGWHLVQLPHCCSSDKVTVIRRNNNLNRNLPKTA